MHKVILNEESIFFDFVNSPKNFEINRDEIKHGIMYGYINNKNLNQYPVDHCLPLDYFEEYIQHFFTQKINYEFNIVLRNKYGFLLKQDESVSLKNDINILDLKHSPDYTLIYGVELEDMSSNLIVHHNNKKIPNCTWTIPMQNNKFIIFPSHLNYEITKNMSKINGCYLIQTYYEMK